MLSNYIFLMSKSINQEEINSKMGIIYKFEIGKYWYVGQTKHTMEYRFREHYRSCCDEFSKINDNSKKYIIMRKLGINRNNFFEMVKCKVIVNCRLDELEYYENLNIELGELNLNTQHSFKYLNGYYRKDYIEYGTLTEEEKKEHILINYENFYLNNKDYNEKYYLGNSEKIKQRSRDYHMKNRDVLNLKKKEYRKNNDEYFKEYERKRSDERKDYYKKTKIHQCVFCNVGKMTQGGINRHCKTKNHLVNVATAYY